MGLLNLIAGRLRSQRRNAQNRWQRPSKTIEKTNLAVSIIAVLIGTGLAIIIAQRQEKTSVNIEDFNRLIKKTDSSLKELNKIATSSKTEITTLSALNIKFAEQLEASREQNDVLLKQLSLSQRAQDNTIAGSRNRLYKANQELANISRDYVKRGLTKADFADPETCSYLNDIERVLANEMDNKYLLENPDMAFDWRHLLNLLNQYKGLFAIYPKLADEPFPYQKGQNFDNLQSQLKQLFEELMKENICMQQTIYNYLFLEQENNINRSTLKKMSYTEFRKRACNYMHR